MKIKRWLIISYILVILSPIITGSILFNWIRDYDRQTQLNDYIENMARFEKYEEILDDPKLYKDYDRKYDFLNEDEKDYIEIKLYNGNGYNIYSSGINSIFTANKENLYKDLYTVKRGYKTDSFKKPVFENNKLIGVYQITLNRNDFIKATNNRIIIAISLFVFHFILVILIITKKINKKINNPLRLLISSMKDFARGENITIDYDSKDEMGELIEQFNIMKTDIEEKDLRLQIEKTSKEYMISAISHDLKTPLTSIRAYAEIIKSSSEDRDIKNYEDIIISKCDYMKEMLEDLHLYSLLTSDYKMDFVTVEGEEFFTMLLSGYSEIVKEGNLKYLEDIKVEGNYIVDVKSMIRVMDNLITNAVRYNEKDGSILILVVSNENTLPDYLNKDIREKIENFREKDDIVIVQNTGENISKEDLDNIFELFYKADNSRSNSKKTGTGLGLNIVKKVIERHGGRIKIISVDDTTTIIYTIKREEEDND